MNQFDHVIRCVPNNGDTIWLECTSQTMPFGFLGNFTDNRPVLLIEKNGSKLAHTPRYDLQANHYQNKLEGKLQPDGSLVASVESHFVGLAFDQYQHLLTLSTKDQRKELLKQLDFPGLNLEQFELSAQRDFPPTLLEKLKLSSKPFASRSGNRLLVAPGTGFKFSILPERIITRKTDFELDRSVQFSDSIQIQLPEAYEVEFLPKAIIMNNAYGSYESTYQITAQTLLYTRNLRIKNGKYKAEEWNAFRDFFLNVSKADGTKLVLKQKP